MGDRGVSCGPLVRSQVGTLAKLLSDITSTTGESHHSDGLLVEARHALQLQRLLQALRVLRVPRAQLHRTLAACTRSARRLGCMARVAQQRLAVGFTAAITTQLALRTQSALHWVLKVIAAQLNLALISSAVEAQALPLRQALLPLRQLTIAIFVSLVRARLASLALTSRQALVLLAGLSRQTEARAAQIARLLAAGTQRSSFSFSGMSFCEELSLRRAGYGYKFVGASWLELSQNEACDIAATCYTFAASLVLGLVMYSQVCLLRVAVRCFRAKQTSQAAKGPTASMQSSSLSFSATSVL